MQPKRNLLVWIDLEMTGLDPKTCTVLEIGAVVTDGFLNVVAEGPYLAIHHSRKVLEGMEPWSRFHHRKSGLTGACRRSKVSLRGAERQVLDFLKRHCTEKTAPLCGNTIGQDRRFLVKYMPKLEAFLHYRSIDVSSVKELVRRWYSPSLRVPRRKERSHRVRADIFESIAELTYYRDTVFIPPSAAR